MIRRLVHSIIRRLGYDLVLFNDAESEKRYIEIFEHVRPYTITSYERVYALIDSTRHLLRRDIKGAFVECGVYRGGSMMAVALVLMEEGITNRDLYLFDTFEGQPAPDRRDIDFRGKSVHDTFAKHRISDVSSTWENCSMEDVAEAMRSTGYPAERIHMIKGLVEETLPASAPDAIALLRLDTELYRSTLHELVHLYPRVSPKGVVILDDYGHFKGAREAVHEFFSNNKMSPFLHRLDYTGRLIVKDE